MALALISLLAAWAGFFQLSRELAARRAIPADWRLWWLLATVGWGALLALIVEASSAVRSLDAPTLAIAWTGSSMGLWVGAYRLARQRGEAGGNLAAGWPSIHWRRFQETWAWDERGMWYATGILVLLLGAVAALTPSTNADSQAYHLPRCLHWIQQHSVAHFPTDDSRQLEFAPWSAFAVTNLLLLWGNDQWVNLVQWFAMLSTVIGASFLAQQLMDGRAGGAATGTTAATTGPAVGPRKASALASLLVVTLPIGVVESLTTQTDYTVTCWLVSWCGLMLVLVRQPSNLWCAGGAGLALALGVLTKATMFLYAAPLVAAFGLWLLRKVHPPRVRVQLAALFLGTFLVLNTPHLLRNFALFGSPLGSPRMFSLERNQSLSPGGTLSNLIRNLALHANTGIGPLTSVLNRALDRLHEATGRSLNDPETSYYVGAFNFREQFMVYDSYASCPYHLLLILAALALALSKPREYRRLLGYALLILASGLLFCLYLRWQKWHTRLHLAYFAVLLPGAALVLARHWPRWLLTLATVGLWLFAAHSLFRNASRPILALEFLRQPREQQYFINFHPGYPAAMTVICDDVLRAGCRNLGLKLKYYEPEYPLWLMLRHRGFHGRLDHYYVEHVSGRITTSAPVPDAVITSYTNPPPPAVRQQLPYHSDYGLLRVLWTEAASHWAVLSRYSGTEPAAPLKPGQSLPFQHRTLWLELRAPHPGRLHLAGRLVDVTGRPLTAGGLAITTANGFHQVEALSGSPLKLEIPMPGGTIWVKTTLQPAVILPPGGITWGELQWRWESAPHGQGGLP